MNFAALCLQNPLEIALRQAQGDFSLDAKLRSCFWTIPKDLGIEVIARDEAAPPPPQDSGSGAFSRARLGSLNDRDGLAQPLDEQAGLFPNESEFAQRR
jgi:hypothetical protein